MDWLREGVQCTKCGGSRFHYSGGCKKCEENPYDRIKQLEEELKDINDSWKIVINEECAKDEVHCTCVPVLRAELLELEKKYADAYFSKDTYKQLEADNQRLTKAIEKEIESYGDSWDNGSRVRVVQVVEGLQKILKG